LYASGGVTSLGAAARVEIAGNSVNDHDQSFGEYVQGGVYWRVGSRFNIGLDFRSVFGTSVSVDFGGPVSAKGDADYSQAGLVLGWGWSDRGSALTRPGHSRQHPS